MSLAPISVPDRQPSPRLTVNLGSNNPFRNRATSPSSASPSTPDFRARPLSTNPFLDDTEAIALPSPTVGSMSPNKPSPTSPPLTGHAAELFANLSLDNKPPEKPSERRPRHHSRPENVPPRPPTDGRPPSHRRPSKDDPDPRRRSRAVRPPGGPGDIFADPAESSRSHRPRPRRNSDSSILERPAKPLDPEEERRRRERRHREREARHRDGKSSRSKRPNRRLDLIDKLDVTGVYGTGLFHHDGPFDACNPHRNRKGLRAAPMQAFPKDSRNMALGGAGPNNSNIDLNQFHGRGEEGYADFATSAQKKKSATTSFDPSSKLEPVHGTESMGLGTSTFLEGAPASRTAIQRRQSETETQNLQNGGLQRKKSLAQKIRGINSRSGSSSAPRVMSPEPYYEAVTSPTDGRPASSSKPRRNEKNPFFQDYDDAYDKKGAKIQEASVDFDLDTKSAARPRSTSSPKAIPGLERRKTTEANSPLGGDDGRPPTQGGGGGGGGFMSRVKSLRRPKPEKKNSSD